MTLSLYMDTSGRNCIPTEDSIAERTKVSRKTVSGHLNRAENLGFLKRYKRSETGKRGFSYGYIAAIPEN